MKSLFLKLIKKKLNFSYHQINYSSCYSYSEKFLLSIITFKIFELESCATSQITENFHVIIKLTYSLRFKTGETKILALTTTNKTLFFDFESVKALLHYGTLSCTNIKILNQNQSILLLKVLRKLYSRINNYTLLFCYINIH